ncbi:protein kinase domain-containing protein [Pendulispora albinea]|uniref:Protein kinase domain-containing protein n=1 Tax=Pendulispora albinea TaxID=2741071 RepID=A0ABZ2LS30_9BACT
MSSLDPFRMIGKTLAGHFLVQSLVGEGRSSVVYKGLHIGPKKAVALKCYKLGAWLDGGTAETFLRRFREESKASSQISKEQPFFVRSIGSGMTTSDEGVYIPYSVLEWLDGRSLGRELAERRARAESTRPLTELLMRLEPAVKVALAHAHKQKILHGDITPGSFFLLDKEPAPGVSIKLLDLGTAKVVRDLAREVAPKAAPQALFSPGHAAPEQLDPKLGEWGPWTDVYGLAVVLLEAMLGRPVAESVQGKDAASIVLDPKKRPTPRNLGISVFDPVERVFAKAVALLPAERWPNAFEFWSELEDAVRAEEPTRRVLPTKMEEDEPEASTEPRPGLARPPYTTSDDTSPNGLLIEPAGLPRSVPPQVGPLAAASSSTSSTAPKAGPTDVTGLKPPVAPPPAPPFRPMVAPPVVGMGVQVPKAPVAGAAGASNVTNVGNVANVTGAAGVQASAGLSHVANPPSSGSGGLFKIPPPTPPPATPKKVQTPPPPPPVRVSSAPPLPQPVPTIGESPSPARASSPDMAGVRGSSPDLSGARASSPDHMAGGGASGRASQPHAIPRPMAKPAGAGGAASAPASPTTIRSFPAAAPKPSRPDLSALKPVASQPLIAPSPLSPSGSGSASVRPKPEPVEVRRDTPTMPLEAVPDTPRVSPPPASPPTPPSPPPALETTRAAHAAPIAPATPAAQAAQAEPADELDANATTSPDGVRPVREMVPPPKTNVAVGNLPTVIVDDPEQRKELAARQRETVRIAMPPPTPAVPWEATNPNSQSAPAPSSAGESEALAPRPRPVRKRRGLWVVALLSFIIVFLLGAVFIALWHYSTDLT